ncbi:MAG: hypothetical protein R2684_03660 [Pyrinomonadaceae bacterium]
MNQIRALFFLISVLPSFTFADTAYRLSYFNDSESRVRVVVEPKEPAEPTANLVFPRSIPGEYSISIYDAFVSNVIATTVDGVSHKMKKDDDDGPRWSVPENKSRIKKIEYRVDLRQMELRMSPGSASVARNGFAGLLNYSVFGWIEGSENEPVKCEVETSSDWPIFSTLAPSENPKNGRLFFETENYYKLADGQTFLGPRFRVAKFNGPVPLYVASFSEKGDEILEDYGTQGVRSMKILNEVFGEIPFPHYSIMLVRAVPLEAGTAPQLAMEHLQSATFFGDTSGARLKRLSEEQVSVSISTYLHHMAHSYIPLRSYGDNYRPHVREIPPLIRNIWFNEGFMWFVVQDKLQSPRIARLFQDSVYNASPAIKELGLFELSQLGSTTYGVDFRIGRAIFSRGALMAAEMDEYLKRETDGKKSMNDVLRFLYRWSAKNKRAFTMEEFPGLLNEAAGKDLRVIYKKWLTPISGTVAKSSRSVRQVNPS